MDITIWRLYIFWIILQALVKPGYLSSATSAGYVDDGDMKGESSSSAYNIYVFSHLSLRMRTRL